MKKLLLKILLGIVAVCMAVTGLIACSNGGWDGTTMTNWGEESIVGGFIGEKGDYVYYINGNAQSNGDNSFGTPIKGTLMAMDKTDFSKTEIVVPKLFVSSDYNAGVYIFGDYVYYGTPSTDKDSTGEIAYSDLVFTKTKLDGTETEKLFTVSGLSTEFRMVEVDGDVYIVYYDTEDLALKEYSVSDEQTKVIASSDKETENMVSLNNYKFGENGDAYIVCYTVNVYTEKYIEEKDDRATATYNKIYGYKVGETYSEDAEVLGEVIATGEPNNITYTMTFIKNDMLFYTYDKDGVTRTCRLSLLDLFAGEVDDSSVVSDASLIYGDKEVYTNVGGKIIKSVLFGNANTEAKTVAVASDVSTLIAVHGDYIYYFDSASGISRIKLNDESAKSEKVSEDTVTTTWYKPQFLTIEGKDYLFYCDNSNTSYSYVKYVDLNGTVEGEDTDDDGENDTFKLTGQKFIGIITESDSANIVINKITAITTKFEDGILPYETDSEGKLYVKVVDEAKAAYDALSDDAKELVTETSLTQLNNYIKAVEMANLYEKLSDVRKDNLDQGQKDALKTTYLEIKDRIEEFKASEDYTTISNLIGNNRLWCYQKAVSLFEAE